jgi:hypothetical protein
MAESALWRRKIDYGDTEKRRAKGSVLLRNSRVWHKEKADDSKAMNLITA